MPVATSTQAHRFTNPDVRGIEIITDNRSSAGYPDESSGRSLTVRSWANRFTSFMTPIAIVTAIFAPVPPSAGWRIRTLSETTAYRPWLDKVWDEDEWRYVPELVSPEQIDALNALLALPLVPDLEFDFREYD
jgi:hypothetical protein